jgi:coenzyme F420-reducing hydrogenase beta subunit
VDKDRIESVVKGGYCIGCGACATARPDLYQIGFNEFGEYQSSQVPRPDGHQDVMSVAGDAICPFSGTSANEDEIGRQLFADHGAYDPEIGYHLKSFVGSVAVGAFRDRGSSGGMTNWLLCQLLEQKLVDGVIHVRPVESAGAHPLFAYALSRSIADVQSGAKSRYYPIEFARVLSQVRETEGEYAFVGVPCFVKAMRLLMREDAVLRRRIKYCVALFCGHLKSTAFADAIAWESGLSPNQMTSIDFRKKLPDRPANRYGVKVDCADGTSLTRPMEGLSTGDWGAGLLKYRACDYCDDVVGETADISFGDAWLPEFVADSRGTNIVVVRNLKVLQVIESGIASAQLDLRPATTKEVVQSQRAGFRHRRHGLKYRLWKKVQAGEWFPAKRVPPTREGISRHDQQLFDARLELTEVSRRAYRDAKEQHDFATFLARVTPLLAEYRSFYRRPWWATAIFRARRIGKMLVKRLVAAGRK